MAIRFLAIDGFNLIRRIYEARHVATRDDMTSVIEAAVSSVRRAIKTHTPGHAAVVLEHHDRTWRHLLYPEYKANRSETPPLLLEFLPEFRAGFESAGVASCGADSYEADDVIATLANVVSGHGGEVVILSTDKIFLQLLSDKVVVYDHFEGKRLDAGYVQDRYGIRVHQYVDYLALVGDKSNNIKGVAGIGPKSAVELLSSYQRLDDLLATDAEDRLVSKVQAARDIALRCRQLVTLKQDVELGLNLKSFRIKG